MTCQWKNVTHWPGMKNCALRWFDEVGISPSTMSSFSQLGPLRWAKPMVKISPSWAPRRRRGATFYFAKLVYNSWLTWFMDVCGMFYHVSYLSLRYLGGEQKQLRYNMIKLGRHRNQHVWFLIVRRNGKHFRLELVFLWSPWFDFTTDLRILGNCQCPSKHQWFDL